MSHINCADDGRHCSKTQHFHRCYCGTIYPCPWCGTKDGFVCPTVNEDEDGFMCDQCLMELTTELQAEAEAQCDCLDVHASVNLTEDTCGCPCHKVQQ